MRPRKGSANDVAAFPLPSSHCNDETPDIPTFKDFTGESGIDLEYAPEVTLSEYDSRIESRMAPQFLALLERQILSASPVAAWKEYFTWGPEYGKRSRIPWIILQGRGLRLGNRPSPLQLTHCRTTYKYAAPEMLLLETSEDASQTVLVG